MNNEELNELKYKILVAEDDAYLNKMIQKRLKAAGYDTDGAHSGQETIDYISKNSNLVVLMDYNLHDMNAEDVVKELTQRGYDITFIVMTGYGDEKIAVKMMKLGAFDFIAKDINLIELVPSIVKQAVYHLEIKNKLARSQMELKESEARYRNIFDNIQDVYYELSPNGIILEISPSVEILSGYKREELIGTSIYDMYVEPEKKCELFDEVWEKGSISDYWLIIKDKCYNSVNCSLSGKLIKWKDEGPKLIGTIRNINERKQLELILKKSEERYRTLVENLPMGIYRDTPGAEGSFLMANNSFLRIFGFNSFEELRNVKAKEIYIDSHERQVFSDVLSRLRRVTAYELKLKKVDGTPIWALVTAIAVYNRHNEIDYFDCVIEDITYRKKAAEELKESEERYRVLVSNLPDYVFVHDRGEIIYVNASITELIGLTEEEVLGRSIFDFVSDEYEELIENNLIRRITGEEIKDYEIEIEGKGGDKRSVIIRSAPIVYNKEPAYLTVLTDVTEMKKTEEELRKAKDEADLANRAKSQFLAIMSHEIRTPMNAILGFSEILKRDIGENAKYNDYINGIIVSGKNLLNIINDILDLSKIEAGRMEIQTEPVNIYHMCKELNTVFSIKTDEKNVNFNIRTEPNLPAWLLLDKIRLRQILINLIGNAFKFTHSGFIDLKVGFVERGRNKIDLIFQLHDSGIGIQEGYLNTIFDPFKQCEDHKNRKYGGTGLGLTITKRLVEAMGGTISVESILGKGSTFTVFMPGIEITMITVIDDPADRDIENIEFMGKYVLLVEDDKLNRQVIKEYLIPHNLNILEADDGKAAIEILENNHIDLIFMDIHMPVMDGYEATKIIKNEMNLADIPVIALTASAMKTDVDEIQNLCDGYIRKPTTKDLVLTHLKKFLPYNIKETEPVKIDEVDEFSAYTKNMNGFTPEILDKLQNELMDSWEKSKNSLVISKIQEFANGLKKLGEENNLDGLINYSNELLEYSSTFKINKIIKNLNQYPELIKIICSYSECCKSEHIEESSEKV